MVRQKNCVQGSTTLLGPTNSPEVILEVQRIRRENISVALVHANMTGKANKPGNLRCMLFFPSIILLRVIAVITLAPIEARV